MRSIHSRHYIYTHWLRIDLNNDEIKQWEQLKDYWNKYDCSMTVYYYDYNPLTEKAIKLDCNQSYQDLDLDVNSMSSGSLKRVKAKPTNITVFNKGIEHFFVNKLGLEVLDTLRKPKSIINIPEEELIIVDVLEEFGKMKNIVKFKKIMDEENWKIVKIESDRKYHYQLYFGKGKQVYNRYEFAFGDFTFRSRFKDRLERFINNVVQQRELNLNNFIGKKINMFESQQKISTNKNINVDVKCIGLVLGINNNSLDIFDFQRPLGEQFYSINLDEFEQKFSKGIYKPNFNILTSYENLEVRKYLYNKAKRFTELCGDWDYRNIDMTNIHLESLKVQKDKIIISCEKYSNKLDDYISCPACEIESKELVNEFNLLDLENRESVLDFMSKIENYIDYDKAEQSLNEQENKKIKEKESLEEMEIEYE